MTAILKILPFLGHLWDKITNKELIDYLKNENAKKDEIIDAKDKHISKLYRRVKKAEKL